MFRLLAVFIACLIFMPSHAVAQNDCPKTIAVIAGDPLSTAGRKILRTSYKELGCEVSFISLPAKRGVLYFNSRKVDGELYRIALIEDAYRVGFVRSEQPLMRLKNVLWAHPDTTIATSKPLGYTRGIKWHELYIEQNRNKLANIVMFDTEEKMFNAYNRGAIGRFLTEKQSLNLLNSQHAFETPPVEKKVVNELLLYHYLHLSYAGFMKRFSQYLIKYQPFATLE